MGIGQGVADVDEDVQQAAQRPFLLGRLRVLPQLVQHLGEAAALDHLHREEQPFLRVDAEFVDRDDVRMFELAGDLGFLDEAEFLLGVGLVEQVLDGDFAADVAVHGSQDGAHAAASDLAPR